MSHTLKILDDCLKLETLLGIALRTLFGQLELQPYLSNSQEA